MAIGPRTRVLLIAAVVFAAVAALVWYLSFTYWSQPVTSLAPPAPDAEQSAAPSTLATPQSEATPTPATEAGATPTTTPQPAASPSADASPAPNNAPAPGASPPPQAQTPTPQEAGDPASTLASMRLLIPVQGIRAADLRDTFSDARSEGRVHDAIDIMAPRGTPVLAAADGRIVKLFQSVKGGITLYQLAAADEHLVFYYAHLERYADGLAEGRVARRGETLGYVGDTGNAAPGNTHLHFQIYRVADPKRFWTGDNLNPYPLLRTAQ